MPHSIDKSVDNRARAADTRPQRAFHYRNVYWLWLSALVIAADQISKQIVVKQLDLYERVVVLPFFNLTRTHNTGAAFSIFADAAPVFFIGLAVAVSIGILIWLRRNPDHERLAAAGLCLILGGALGNAIDRAARGYVIDFIDLYAASWHWPAFNLADSAITVGAALILLDLFLQRGHKNNDGKHAGPAAR